MAQQDPNRGHSITIEPSTERVKVLFNGEIIADSPRALLLREGRLPPVYYFPRQDVRLDRLQRTTHSTHCPFKGDASYWTLSVGGKRAENAVWSYENPLPGVARIQRHMAFYPDRVDAIVVEGEPSG